MFFPVFQMCRARVEQNSVLWRSSSLLFIFQRGVPQEDSCIEQQEAHSLRERFHWQFPQGFLKRLSVLLHVKINSGQFQDWKKSWFLCLGVQDFFWGRSLPEFGRELAPFSGLCRSPNGVLRRAVLDFSQDLTCSLIGLLSTHSEFLFPTSFLSLWQWMPQLSRLPPAQLWCNRNPAAHTGARSGSALGPWVCSNLLGVILGRPKAPQDFMHPDGGKLPFINVCC